MSRASSKDIFPALHCHRDHERKINFVREALPLMLGPKHVRLHITKVVSGRKMDLELMILRRCRAEHIGGLNRLAIVFVILLEIGV